MFERKKSAGKIFLLPVDDIHPSPYQARTSFDEAELAGLAQSIRENGLLQPITVRKTENGYELVAGERRLRACKLAKMSTIPSILCDYSDHRTAALGLLENLQRADLNPFEQAQGLRDVMVLWDCTQAEAAKRLGMAQPTLANKLRLLKHSEPVLLALREAGLTERHARALLKLPTEESKLGAIKEIVRQGMSVARTEKYVETLLSARADRPSRANVGAFLNNLTQSLQKIQLSGIPAVSERRETDSQIVLTITIPK